MKSKSLMVLVLVVVLIATPLFASAQSESTVIVTRRETIPGSGVWYTQTMVVLGGANNWIKIPDTWNGRLVVLCRGFSHILDPNAIPMDAQSVGFLSMGAATAASNYGEGGYCVKEGVIHTHQLTGYVIENYGVTGNVYLFGASMGGNIALELGAKYPDLYDGVFDLFGSKELKTQYAEKMDYVEMDDATLLGALEEVTGVAAPPYPFSVIPGATLSQKLATFRMFSLNSATDISLACGGNLPEEKPQAYERISPTFSAVDIAVPTITLHGTADGLVPYSQSLEFKDAVAEAGHSDLYRLYKVNGAGHGDVSNTAIGIRFSQLVSWVEVPGYLPPASST